MGPKTKNMTEGNAMKLMLLFAVPLMLGSIFQQLYSIVDTIIVGKALGVDALAALGATDWINWMIIGLVQGFTHGLSIRMAKEFGARRTDELKNVIGCSVILSLFAAILVTGLSEIFVPTFLKLLHTPEKILGKSVIYLRVLFAGIPIITAYNFLSALLRSLGDSKTPLYAMIAASLANIVLDLIFVLIFHWGIAGAAAATVLAQCVSVGYCWISARKLNELHLQKRHFRFHDSLGKNLLLLSVPNGVQNTIICIGGMVVQFMVNSCGITFIAGYTATNKLYCLMEIAATSYGYAVVTYVGQNLGAGYLTRIRSGVRKAAVSAISTAVVIGIVMILIGKGFLSLFLSGSPEEVSAALQVGLEYLRIMSFLLPLLYILHTYRSALQGLGKTVLTLYSGIIEVVMRTASAFFLTKLIGNKGLFYAEPAAWFGAVLILVLCYLLEIRRLQKIPDFSAIQ